MTRENRKGLYFIFQDMVRRAETGTQCASIVCRLPAVPFADVQVVRPEGKYALDGKVLDLAG